MATPHGPEWEKFKKEQDDKTRAYQKAEEDANSRHIALLGSHHSELYHKGQIPVRTHSLERGHVASETAIGGRLVSTDNGKEFHHRWYTHDGVPVNSPKR